MFLRREREQRRMTLEEIASYTRIKVRALEAIEHDDFSSLPPLAFVRAFIRCYADYLGLNVSDVMVRFDSFIQNRYPELTGEVTLIQNRKKQFKPPDKKWFLVLAPIAVVMVFFYLLWSHFSGPPPANNGGDNGGVVAGQTTDNTGPDNGDGQTTVDNGGGRTENGPAKKPWKTPSPWAGRHETRLGPPGDLAYSPRPVEDDPGEDAPRPAGVGHRVTVKIKKGKCYIYATGDDGDERTVIVNAGVEKVFEAKYDLMIKLSNPDSVEWIIYNGEQIDYDPKCSPWRLYFPPSNTDPQPCLRR